MIKDIFNALICFVIWTILFKLTVGTAYLWAVVYNVGCCAIVLAPINVIDWILTKVNNWAIK